MLKTENATEYLSTKTLEKSLKIARKFVAKTMNERAVRKMFGKVKFHKKMFAREIKNAIGARTAQESIVKFCANKNLTQTINNKKTISICERKASNIYL
jgi:hypothetical protein